MRHHGNAQGTLDGRVGHDTRWQSGGFGSKEENVPALVGDICEVVFRVSGEREDAVAVNVL